MILEGKPLKGKGLELLKNYLIKNGKRYDEKIEYSVCILNDSYERKETKIELISNQKVKNIDI